MNSVQAWSLILGFFTPLLVSVVTKSSMQPWVKQVIAVVTSVVIGVINLAVSDHFNNVNITVGNVLIVLAAVLGAAQATYTLLWKPSGIAEAVEAKVNGEKTATTTEGGYTTAGYVLIVLGIIAVVLAILWLLGVHVGVK